jgi:TatD DNase family protein
LPINIHCREAFDEVFEILEDEKSQRIYLEYFIVLQAT